MNEEEKNNENPGSVEIELATAIKDLQDKQKEYDDRLKAIEKKNVEMIRSIISGRKVDVPEEKEEEEEIDDESILLNKLRKKFKLED